MRSLLIPALTLTLSAAPSPKLLATQVAPGGLLPVVLEGGGAAQPALRARLGERTHPFFPHPADPEHRSAVLVPIPFDTPPGPRELVIEGEGSEQRLAFTVLKGHHPTLTLKVAPQIAQPSAEDLARAKREREEILACHAASPATRRWSAPFREPLRSTLTCGFGATRRFNGVTQSVHKGVDLRAATGTPVQASAPGVVCLAKDLFFGGNLVLIDHGFGLFTSYAHLSRLEVKPGQTVAMGERLGLSGATGRVSGPHLHWGSSIGSVEVDPRELKRWTTVLAAGPRASAPAKTRPPRHGRRAQRR